VAKLLACFGFLFAVGIVYAFSSGPLPGFTDAPGEGNCTECHDSFGEQPNQGPGMLAIEVPPRYELSQRLTLTVSISQPGQRRWGFEITALTANTNEPAGQFVITDSTRTQLIQDSNGRFYVEHTSAGTSAGQLGGTSWSFDWIAPDTDVGPVAFYAAGNAANGDGERLGDWIYTAATSISPPSFPAVTLLAPHGAEVLGIGQPFTIRWEASNANSFDVLFLPREGALPETIVSGLPGDARSYDWTAPTMATDSASIAVLAYNDSGFGLAQSESPFMIVDKSSALAAVLEPSGPRVVKGGAHLKIVWNVSATLNITRQQIRLSLDSGQTYPLVLAPSLSARARSFDWVVPVTLQTQSARVMVLASVADGNIVAAANDADLIIFNAIVPATRAADGESGMMNRGASIEGRR
jgi:hypothetical protein